MARSSLQITVDQRTPVTINDVAPKAGRQLLRKVIRHLEGVLGGVVDASSVMIRSDGAQPLAAVGTVIAAAVAAADTVSINAQALTATEARANCAVTCASVQAGDTVTVNGKVFTAANGSPTSVQFDMSGTDAATALSLASAITNSTGVEVDGLIEATRHAADGVVSIYALATGTAGNSYTIATSNGTRLAITLDSSGSFAGGAATANNQFDPFGSNIMVATEIARALNASTTAIVVKHIEASNWAGSVALSGCTAGTRIEINNHVFTAVAAAANVLSYGDFSISGNDSADGDALVTAINAHPVLSHQVFAVNSGGTVTIQQKRGTSSLGKINCVPLGSQTVTQFAATATVRISSLEEGQTGNAITLASSNGTRLAVSAARLAGGTGPESGTLTRILVGTAAQ